MKNVPQNLNEEIIKFRNEPEFINGIQKIFSETSTISGTRIIPLSSWFKGFQLIMESTIFPVISNYSLILNFSSKLFGFSLKHQWASHLQLVLFIQPCCMEQFGGFPSMGYWRYQVFGLSSKQLHTVDDEFHQIFFLIFIIYWNFIWFATICWNFSFSSKP